MQNPRRSRNSSDAIEVTSEWEGALLTKIQFISKKKQDLLFPIFFWPSVNLDLEKLNIKWRWGDGEEKERRKKEEARSTRIFLWRSLSRITTLPCLTHKILKEKLDVSARCSMVTRREASYVGIPWQNGTVFFDDLMPELSLGSVCIIPCLDNCMLGRRSDVFLSSRGIHSKVGGRLEKKPDLIWFLFDFWHFNAIPIPIVMPEDALPPRAST